MRMEFGRKGRETEKNLDSIFFDFRLFSFSFCFCLFYGVLTGDRRKEKRCANEEKNPPPIFGVGAKHRPLFFSIAKLF